MAHGSADLEIAFTRAGTAARHCRDGWSVPEAEETWCLGHRSTLVLPLPAADATLPAADATPPVPTPPPPPRPWAHVLVLRARPHVVAGKLPAQRLRVLANGVQIGAFTLTRRAVRACLIPPDLIGGHGSVEITFETPDAARPSDFGDGADDRPLAVAFSALRLYPDRFSPSPAQLRFIDATPPAPAPGASSDEPPLADLLRGFESLGQNCEFGLVQRRGGAEPLGLLRFASTPLPNLLAALDGGFVGLGAPGTLRVAPSANGRELMVTDARYGLVYHAWVTAGEMTPEAVVAREERRVPLLVRKLLEDLTGAEKIFVFKGMGPLEEEVAFPLATALRRYGPNTLLAVTLADTAHPAGLVEARAPGLFFGYLDRFAPGEDAHDFSFDPWVAICRGARRLVGVVRGLGA